MAASSNGSSTSPSWAIRSIRPVLACDGEQVAKAGRGQERCASALPLQDRVRGNGRAMHDLGRDRARGPEIIKKEIQTLEHRP
jgi:hypothetical protein